MRKQTEIQLLLERPHVYPPAILTAMGISCDAHSKIVFGHRHIYKSENFFDVGEGWLPIISAFAECLDQIIEMAADDPSKDQVEDHPVVFIAGASNHHHRLRIHVETNQVADETYAGEIESMKAYAAAMSAMCCEICGTRVIGIVEGPVRCKVCQCRNL